MNPPDKEWKPSISGHYGSAVWSGYAVIVTALALIVGWGSITKIDSAVIASGTVVLDSRRQVVENFDGGIVSQLLAHEGKSVEEGELLLVVNADDTMAEVAILRKELDFAKAAEARIKAEMAGEVEPHFSVDLLSRAERSDIALLLEEERKKTRQWHVTLASQINVLENRKTLFANERQALEGERVAVESQLASLKEELEGLHILQNKGLVEKSRVLPLEREVARNVGIISRNRADLEKTQHNIDDLDLQIAETRERSAADLLKEMADTRQKRDELPGMIAILESKVRRTQIVAPRSGAIQNLKISTIGQVVKPGELLLEIVPKDDVLIVQAEVAPNDVADVQEGRRAEIRFPSFHSRLVPTIYGAVISVSKDRIEASPPKSAYFLAQLQIDRSTMPDDFQAGLKAGIAAEILLPRGERSVLDYLMQPFVDSIRHTFREK
jgi:HlyD family secretion protein